MECITTPGLFIDTSLLRSAGPTHDAMPRATANTKAIGRLHPNAPNSTQYTSSLDHLDTSHPGKSSSPSSDPRNCGGKRQTPYMTYFICSQDMGVASLGKLVVLRTGWRSGW